MKLLYNFFLICLFSFQLFAQKAFMLGGWIPYWRSLSAIESARFNCDLLDHLSPFSLEIDKHGTLKNPFHHRANLWKELREECKKRDKNKLFVPTFYWTDTQQMHHILSNKVRRDDHVRQIVEMIVNNNYDGININYERVSSNDREDYLLFMKQLSQEMHKRDLVLYTTIGGRTGDNTIGVIYNKAVKEEAHKSGKHSHKHKHGKQVHISLNPGKGEDARRYKKTLVECCDLIFFMAYDEWGRPYHYNKEHLKNKYYVSHSSSQWTEQIIQYGLSFIPPHKMAIGIPTYGLEFAIFHKGNEICIQKRRNVTYPQALEVAKTHHVTLKRTAGGELSYTYRHGREERYVCFLDAQAVKDKMDLVKKYGLKGMYIFTINGDVDKSIWDVLKKEIYKK